MILPVFKDPKKPISNNEAIQLLETDDNNIDVNNELRATDIENNELRAGIENNELLAEIENQIEKTKPVLLTKGMLFDLI